MNIDKRPVTPCVSNIDSPAAGCKQFDCVAHWAALLRGGEGVKSAVSTISLFLLYLLNYVAAYCRVDNDKLLCVELSVEMRVSLEDEKTAMEKQLTDEYTQLKLELDTIKEKKKDVETKLENQQQTSTQQMDRQRQGSCWPYHSLREFGFTFLYSD